MRFAHVATGKRTPAESRLLITPKTCPRPNVSSCVPAMARSESTRSWSLADPSRRCPFSRSWRMVLLAMPQFTGSAERSPRIAYRTAESGGASNLICACPGVAADSARPAATTSERCGNPLVVIPPLLPRSSVHGKRASRITDPVWEALPPLTGATIEMRPVPVSGTLHGVVRSLDCASNKVSGGDKLVADGVP